MGTYYSLYIGVYMEVPDKTIQVSKTYFVDANGNTKKNKFDPETGEQYQEKTIMEDELVRACSYIEDEDGEEVAGLKSYMFSSPEVHGTEDGELFILNMSDTKYTMDMEGIDSYDQSFNIEWDKTLDPDALISEFREEYQDYIDYYEDKYGPVKIKYGIVRSGS